MKPLHLLGATAASLAVGHGRPSRHSHSGGLRRLLQNDTAFHNATCDLAAGERECHNEVGWIMTCAPRGGECPCFFNEERCHSPRFGDYCDTVCCEWGTQEKCRKDDPDDPGISDVWCADVADGGCPCPDGQVKCGVTEVDGGHSGYCTALCCEDGEQTCYDDNYDPSYCALIEEGGCPCPEGQVKCGGTDDWAGYCTAECCDPDTEETCYGANATKTCRKIDEGGCKVHETNHGQWKARMVSTILSKGTGSQVAYYASIRERRERLSMDGKGSVNEVMAMLKHLEAEEAALFHAIRVRKGRTKKLSKEKEEAAFFLEEVAAIF